MKAIVFTEKGKVEVWNNLILPELKQEEVKLETLFSAVSVGTERNILLGGPYFSRFPVICGYQTISKVIDKGRDIKNLELGDIVYSDSGSKPENFNGASWGGHIEVRNRNINGNIIKIPKEINLEEASYLGVMSVGMRAASRGKVSINDKVLVIGLGLIGQSCAQASSLMGADVYGVDINPKRLSVGLELACTKVWDTSKDSAWEEIKSNHTFDVIFETTSLADMIDKSLAMIRPESGRIVQIGGKFEMKYQSIKAQLKETTIIHTSHFSLTDLQNVLRHMISGKIKAAPLITHRLKVDEAPKIYQKIITDPDDILGVVFNWK